MTWDRVRDVVAKLADEPRPLVLAEVIDTNEWAASGPSWINVRTRDAQRRVIYRDGPAPAIGSPVQIVKMGAGPVAEWLALPLPPVGCAGLVYCSLRETGGLFTGTAAEWKIGRFDLALMTWEFRSNHPAGASGSLTRRPLRGWPDPGVLLTWAGTPAGGGGTLYRSTDGGASWSSTGLSGVLDVTDTAHNWIGYAVTDSAVYRTTDAGASWSAMGGSAPPGGTWRRVKRATVGFGENALVSLASTAGACIGTDFFGTLTSVGGPFAPAPSGAFPPLSKGQVNNLTGYRPGAGGAAPIHWFDVGSVGTPAPPYNLEQAGDTLESSYSADLEFTEDGPIIVYNERPTADYAGDGSSAWNKGLYCAGGAGNGTVELPLSYSTDHGYLWDNDTQHPHGLTGLGVHSAERTLDGCLFVAIEDADAGVSPHTKFAVNLTGVADGTPGQDATANMLSAFGSAYVACRDGLASLEV